MSEQTRRGLEQALARAVVDAPFRARLLADRSRAALEEGIALTDSERTVLDSVPAAQLEEMISGLPPVPVTPPPELVVGPSMGIRPDEIGIVRGHTSGMTKVALGAVAVGAVAVGVGVCATLGHTAKVPPPRTEVQATPSRPDAGTIDRGDKGADPKR
jgi:hypothetical protein